MRVAPLSMSLLPIYTTTNLATDQNQLTMEIMQRVAAKHDMVCLLHESPLPESMAAASTTTGPSPPTPVV